MEFLSTINEYWGLVIAFCGVVFKLISQHFAVQRLHERVVCLENTINNHAEALNELRDMRKDIQYIKENLKDLKRTLDTINNK